MVFRMFSGGPDGPLIQLGIIVVASLLISITGIVLGIIALATRSEVDRGWTRLRAGFGIGLGVIGLCLPCLGGFVGFATISTSSPPVIYSSPSVTPGPVQLSPPPVTAPEPPAIPPPAPQPSRKSDSEEEQ